ncbi:MAG TPA: protease complex subunit PrcB family protein [Thermoanaerobaculia bacterium]
MLAGALLSTSIACEDNGPTAPGEPLPFSSFYETWNSGIVSARAEVIRDEQRWAAVWSEIQGSDPTPEPRPTVDFTQDMLVLVGIGERPSSCWGVSILSLDSSAGRIHVRSEERRPGANCVCFAVMTRSVHVVRAARTDGALSSEIVSRNVGCP